MDIPYIIQYIFMHQFVSRDVRFAQVKITIFGDRKDTEKNWEFIRSRQVQLLPATLTGW